MAAFLELADAAVPVQHERGRVPASLKLMPFGRASLLLAWGMVVAVSGFLAWRGRVELLPWVRQQRWLLVAVEGAFLAGTALFLWMRAANPDLWHPVFGGEKPMNFAYLNAVVKSDYFPPYDPWFADGYINYYYFGFVLVAALIKLTGVVPAVAFNLAQPTLFGAVCAGAFSLAFNLSVPARGALRRASAYVAGTAAVFLVGVLGNLDAGLQVLDQLWRLGGQLEPESGGIPRLVMGIVAIVQGQRFPPLDFWRSTRFIGPENPGPIHEFPYFTFLYGDLHAHQIALPLTVGRIAARQRLLDRKALAIGHKRVLGAACCQQDRSDIVVTDGKIALPIGVARIGQRQPFANGP